MVQAHADQVLLDQQARPQHLQACFELAASTQHAEVQFWCIKCLLETVTSPAFETFSDSDKQAIAYKVAAWCFASETPALCLSTAPFIQNKIAQLFAHLAARLYPAHLWPSCFQDALAATFHNAAHTPMLLRTLLALDQDIISLEIPRNDAESRRSMALKDALRERDIAEIAQAWAYIVERNSSASGTSGGEGSASGNEGAAQLVAMCLTVVQRYADWVDIHLIASDRFVSILRALLQGALPLARSFT